VESASAYEVRSYFTGLFQQADYFTSQSLVDPGAMVGAFPLCALLLAHCLRAKWSATAWSSAKTATFAAINAKRSNNKFI
jgi:hypothetical protein